MFLPFIEKTTIDHVALFAFAHVNHEILLIFLTILTIIGYGFAHDAVKNTQEYPFIALMMVCATVTFILFVDVVAFSKIHAMPLGTPFSSVFLGMAMVPAIVFICIADSIFFYRMAVSFLYVVHSIPVAFRTRGRTMNEVNRAATSAPQARNVKTTVETEKPIWSVDEPPSLHETWNGERERRSRKTMPWDRYITKGWRFFASECVKYVIGQADAIHEVCRQIQVGVKKKVMGAQEEKPVAVILLVGPSGVGKTETAKVMTRLLKEHVSNNIGYLVFDMSEFYDRHTASRLIGAPPGYKGTEEGGQLTKAIWENPARVVLFDEIEKADMSVHTMFLQILHEGRITEASSGKSAKFDQCAIFLTSNLCQESIRQVIANHGMTYHEKHAMVMDILKKGDEQGRRLPPEIIGRINAIVAYKSLDEVDYIAIIEQWLKQNNIHDKEPVKIWNQVKGFADSYGVRGVINQVEMMVYAD
jgi:hypothetical protein